MSKPSYIPKCPNHSCALEGVGFPMPAKGTGQCPVSGASFDFEAEVEKTKMVKDKDGNLTPSVGWKVSGDEE